MNSEKSIERNQIALFSEWTLAWDLMRNGEKRVG